MTLKIQFTTPAQPGCYSLEFEDGEIFKSPILAWGIDAEGVAYPITLSPFGIDATEKDSWEASYLFPDGMVHGRLGAFPDFDAWLLHQNKKEVSNA